METLNKPLFYAAIACITLAFLIEIGASFTLPGLADTNNNSIGSVVSAMCDTKDPLFLDQCKNKEKLIKTITAFNNQNESPPGYGISLLAVLDGLVVFTVLLMASPMIISAQVYGKIQGVSTFAVSLITIGGSIFMATVVFSLLMVMISLFVSAPFGTMAYMVIYGYFDTTSASITLGLIMTLKTAFAVLLIMSHHRFLQNKSLIFIIACSFLTTIIVSLLHNIVPSFLVNITDAVAGLIVAIIGLIWAIIFLVGSLPSILKALKIS